MGAGRIAWDFGNRTELGIDETPEMVCVVCRVGDDMPDPLQPLGQRARLRTIAPVPGCDHEADRQPKRIDGGVDLAGQPAARPADCVSRRPPF